MAQKKKKIAKTAAKKKNRSVKKNVRSGKKCALRKKTKAAKNSIPKRPQRTPSFKNLKLKEAVQLISSHLASRGHNPVLIGEACAYLYFGTVMTPKTIEFSINNYSIDMVNAAMLGLGFIPTGEHSFVNEKYPVEVLLTPHPVSVGDDIVENYRILKTAKGSIKALTPTDCVRHRLAVFYRFGERTALSDAVKVARRQKVDLDFVRRWSGWEWAGDKFEEFLKEVSNQ